MPTCVFFIWILSQNGHKCANSMFFSFYLILSSLSRLLPLHPPWTILMKIHCHLEFQFSATNTQIYINVVRFPLELHPSCREEETNILLQFSQGISLAMRLSIILLNPSGMFSSVSIRVWTILKDYNYICFILINRKDGTHESKT